MERIQVSAALAAPAPDIEARDNTNRPLKPRNPDLYYGNLHMECYYFCQQCEDHFEVAGSLGYKYIPFATGFLKNHILNRWQQHKTSMQRSQLAPMTWDEFKAFLRKSLGESNTFVGHIWSKLRRDAQHQLEEVQDWTAHLEHFQSILLEFDANNAPQEGQLGRTFYDGLRPLIKLWIADTDEDIPWDDLIRAANKAEARAKIQRNTHLDQRCPKEKRPLKMSLNSRDDQTKALQDKDKANLVAQVSEAEKFSEKVRKEKKKKDRQEQREKPTPATGANIAPATATGGEGQRKKKKAWDVSEVTCYSCNKKGHYTSNGTTPKN